MRTVLLIVLSATTLLAQETYVSNENVASAGGYFGRYAFDTKWGVTGSYSIKGILQLSYTRSSVLTEPALNNYKDEYFLRIYIPQQKKFFFSIGGGYIYQHFDTELWKSYPLLITSDGAGIEAGVHLVTETSTSRRVVVSLIYMYSNPLTELRTPDARIVEANLSRSFEAEVAVVYYLGHIGLVIGPRLDLDSDFRNAFIGVKSSLILIH